MLVHFGPGFDAVWPSARKPQRRPLVYGPLEERRRRTHLLFAERCSKRIAQMANHLVRRHASPLSLTIRPHTAEPVE